ncbi:DNA ligase I [Tricladium varicosporioides]|nr:DNA ligase I [Hymenoscyphus varicosporioides]
MARSQKPPENDATEGDQSQYGYNSLPTDELDDKYPNRPQNHSKTFFFHELIVGLFDPLSENKKPTGPKITRKKVGPHGPSKLNAHEARTLIIEKFISRWRQDVGNDFYPALRLIIPEKDRDRAMYGLKEKAIGKLIVKLLNLNPHAEDGFNLLNWKLPGQSTTTRMAGDFAGRCYEVLAKRPMRTEYGDMRIAEVNELLDQLSTASKEEQQLPIFRQFYTRMNADELKWLIRIILREMKVGASEKTILNLWHPNGEDLFNVSSSLRRVCWELTDPTQRLDGEDTGVSIMECFQPQLAQFQDHSFQRMIEKLGTTAEDPTFWIEEKLDGERMQMHMQEDGNIPGGYRFAFWSRKGKDYTYLYGSSFEDDNSALTRHLKNAFDSRVKNMILDGEMITWDPETNKMVDFGTLKTAAISEQKNPFQTGPRPLFRVFDCLFLNDQRLTQYMLKDRRQALEGSVKNVHNRLEIHRYQVATSAEDIDPALRKVVAEASEGLVLKNPRSVYQLNSRNDNWVKVKPEYMTEFGESLDCVVIGGYYGSGHRGGALSSFLCGLRVDDNHIKKGASPMKCFSFFKVGGGFRAEDYANIKHQTEGKWVDWDGKHPPTEYVELGGPHGEAERPDQWIKPCDSVVLEVKAASVAVSDQFKTRYSLRFPRFKKLRMDKDWKSALSLSEFEKLKNQVEKEDREKEFKLDTKRKMSKKLKKELVIAGNDDKIRSPYAGPETKIFSGLTFCVMTDMFKPQKKSKAELQQIIKANGGAVTQNPTANDSIICVGDMNAVKVSSLVKRGQKNVIRPSWILDALKQGEIDGPQRERLLIPFEPMHMFFATEVAQPDIEGNVDQFGDSYARDVTTDELKNICDGMIHPKNYKFSAEGFVEELEERGHGFSEITGSIFSRCIIRFVPAHKDEIKNSNSKIDFIVAENRVRFAGGHVAKRDDQLGITHFVVLEASQEKIKYIRADIASWRGKLPRVVNFAWLQESWKEKTLLDEEHYVV